MWKVLVFAFASGLSTASAATGAEEPHGIYVVRGEASQLQRFHADIGSAWQGGKFLEKLSSNVEYRYWASPTRTAREARVFLFGSLQHALRLDIEEYQEASYYPDERAKLDGIAARCKVRADVLFLEPDRTLVVRKSSDEASSKCIATELQKTLVNVPVRFVADQASGERG